MEHFLEITPYQAIFPPLGLLTLAALTPPEFEVVICDENAGEPIDFDSDADIIGVTGYIIQLTRMFEIADRFRARGKTVLIGGPAANLLTAECKMHCDVVFEGEAEYTWPRFLREFAAGIHSDFYVEHEKIHLPDSPPLRLGALRARYVHGIVQCTRGCPFTCEFCDIIVMYGRKMRFKPVEHVIQDVQAWYDWGVTQVFFADDNFIGHRAYAKDLLRALIRWNAGKKYPLSFYTQASIDMVRDEELLGLLRDANFISVFIGIESPRKSSLAETHKAQNVTLDLVEAIHKIQSYNLFISAGMIVGFDNDDASIFDEQYNFLQEAGIPIVMLSVLLAIPKTPLYDRLKAAGRLRTPDPTGTDRSHFVGTAGGTNFEPMNMTGEELRQGQQQLYRRLYAPKIFEQRLLANLHRFSNVSYRPQRTKPHDLGVLWRLFRHYWSHGPAARKLFFGTIWKTLRHSPRNLTQMIMYLGMYMHFCKVHAQGWAWDPWKEEKQISATRQLVAEPEHA